MKTKKDVNRRKHVPGSSSHLEKGSCILFGLQLSCLQHEQPHPMSIRWPSSGPFHDKCRNMRGKVSKWRPLPLEPRRQRPLYC